MKRIARLDDLKRYQWMGKFSRLLFVPGFLFLLLSLGSVDFSWGKESTAEKTTIAKFRGNKQCAFTWQFDDSAPSQVDFVIPHLNARGLRGTFFANPGTERYKAREWAWTHVCPLWDQELANHSLHHTGAKDFEEAKQEVGTVNQLIWKLYPHKSRLVPFKSGGATSWNITKEQWRELPDKYPTSNRGPAIGDIDPSGYDPMPTKEEMISAMDKAEAQEGWVAFQLHGVGPIGLSEWLPTNGELFDAMLDKLVNDESKVWVGPEGEVYRYIQERDHVKTKTRYPAKEGGNIRVEITTRGLDKDLFIEPLTLLTEVPGGWKYVLVQRDGKTLSCHKPTWEKGKSVVVYDAAPNRGEVVLKRADKETVVSSGRPDVLKIRQQVASPLLRGLKPSSLIDLGGDIRGYVYQGSGRAVAAVWYHGHKRKTNAVLHDYSAEGIHWFLKPDNRHIDVNFVKLSTLKFQDASGKDLGVYQGKTETPLELTSKPIYLVGQKSRDLENVVLYGFLKEAPHY